MDDITDTFNGIGDDLASIVLLPQLAIPDKPFLVNGAVFYLILEHSHEAFCIAHIRQLELFTFRSRLIPGNALGNGHHRIVIQRRLQPIPVLCPECCQDAFFSDTLPAQCSCQRSQMVIPTAFRNFLPGGGIRRLLFYCDLGANLTDFLYQPCGHFCRFHVEGGFSCIPRILLSAAVGAGCCYDHAALCPHIQTVPESNHIFEAQFIGILEDIMLTAATRGGCDRVRQEIKLIHEHGQTLFSFVAGIHIQSHEAALFTHGDADIGRRCFAPPLFDLCRIGCRFLIPVFDAGVLALCTAHSTLPAGAISVLLYPVQREHWYSRCRVS